MRDIDKFKRITGTGLKRQNGRIVAGENGVYTVAADSGATIRVDGGGAYAVGQRVAVFGNRIIGTVDGSASGRAERG